MSDLFAGHERIRRTLEQVRYAFEDAMVGDNAFTIGGTELRADQVRGVASMVGGDENWSERGGRKLIRNDSVLGRAFLAYGIGTGRYLSAGDFETILSRLLQNDMGMTREPDLAQFVNLVAAEPRRDPRVEPLIWATVAHKLATGESDAYFSQEIPGLVTTFDPLHSEMPAGSQLTEGLSPGSARPRTPDLERYELWLQAELGSDLATYVREHLLSRVDPRPS